MNSELETLVSLDTLTTVPDEAAQEINSLLRSGIEAAKNGNRDEAKALLFRVTDIDPDNEMAWLWLASVSEYPEELLTFLQKVLNINPQNEQALEWERSTKGLLARNLVQYGITAVQENKKESAKRCFVRALETDANNEMAWLWMASITEDQGEKNAHLEKVLAINPDNEVAGTLLKIQRKDEAQDLLQKSKASAVRGDRREALEMLEQVKQLDNEIDEVWILQAHLSESFEEKAFCFNQALACNPENEVARFGLASLESILQAVNGHGGNGNGNGHSNITGSLLSPELEEELNAPEETVVEKTVADEPQEVVSEEAVNESFADIIEEFSAADAEAGETAETAEEQVSAFESAEEAFETEASFSFIEENALVEEPVNAFPEAGAEVTEPEELFETEDSFDAVTGDLDEEVFAEADQEMAADAEEKEPVGSFEPATLLENDVEEEAVSDTVSGHEEVEEAAVEEVQMAEDEAEEDTFFQPEPAAEDAAENVPESDPEIKAETFYFGQNEIDETLATFEEVEQGDKTAVSEAAEFASSNDAFETDEEVNDEMQLFEAAPEQAPFAQISACPFCAGENNINDEVCGECNAVLGLHNLDMLLSQEGVDREKLSEAVEGMEANLESESFSAEEYFNLGLACLNLKDLDNGLKYLQKSYILNSTNSFLKSQIDELAKRIDKNEGESVASVEGDIASKTIMVVDDSATIRKLVSAKLEKHGHNVIAAVDGMDALAKLEEIVPDLILLDITMPRLDGYQVCKLIRANENTRFVPIVLISGKDGFFDKVRGKMCGSTTYITKPFGPEMLLRTVESYFQ